MNKKDYEQQIQEIVKKLSKEIDRNYSVKLPEITPIYENNEIINEKEVKKQSKLLTKLIVTIWTANALLMSNANKEVLEVNFAYYGSIKERIGLPVFTRQEINKMIDSVVKKRSDMVKIKQVIQGNANSLNNRMQNKVKELYQNGATKKDIQKMLKKEFEVNSSKAKTIATTEVNYYKSEAQLKATEGLPVKKIWRHRRAREPRETHLNAHGQEVIGHDALFQVGEYKTIAPQHFGIASEDINCHCEIDVIVLDKGNIKVE